MKPAKPRKFGLRQTVAASLMQMHVLRVNRGAKDIKAKAEKPADPKQEK